MLCYGTFGATGGGLGTLAALEEERKKGKRKWISCGCTTSIIIFHFNISFEKNVWKSTQALKLFKSMLKFIEPFKTAKAILLNFLILLRLKEIVVVVNYD